MSYGAFPESEAAPPPEQAYTMKIFTGPTMTEPLAAKCEEAGIEVLAVGTEHIYPAVAAPVPEEARDRFLDALRARHGRAFGLQENIGGGPRFVIEPREDHEYQGPAGDAA